MNTKCWTICVLVALLSILEVAGQGVSVRVQDNLGQTLPGVYVAINGKVQYSTDSVGHCQIDHSALAAGDSIAVSMLGYGRAVQVVEPGKAEYAFTLGEVPTYTIEAVNVQGSILKFYVYSVNSYIPRNGVVTADFTVNIRRRGEDSTHVVRGRLSFENKVWGKGMQRFEFGLFHLNNQVQTDLDTAQFKGFDRYLKYVVATGFAGMGAFTNYPTLKYMMENHQATIRYVKREADILTFLLTANFWSPLEDRKIVPRQSLIKINKAEHEVFESRTSYLFTDPETRAQFEDSNYITYVPNAQKDKAMYNRYLPSYIAHNLSNKLYERWDIALTNIVFKPKK